jgi:hypothetical protein
LFVGFTATMAESDFSRPCIIGYDSSSSRCGPPTQTDDGQTRDIPGSNAIHLRVMWPSTPLHMLRSTMKTVSALTSSSFRGSLPHPTQPLCTLRVRRRRRLTQHSLPGGLLGLTWAGLAPADRASFAGAPARSPPRRARRCPRCPPLARKLSFGNGPCCELKAARNSDCCAKSKSPWRNPVAFPQMDFAKELTLTEQHVVRDAEKIVACLAKIQEQETGRNAKILLEAMISR